MNLNYEVFYSDKFWWFRMVEVSSFGAPVSILYRRRYKTSGEAERCGQQALEHERTKREEYRQMLLQQQDEAPVEN